MHGLRLTTIVSGGQTGADRAALDVAQALGLTTGGWVPRGRRAEDGVIPQHYAGLRETPAANPAVRTALNVRDSDATLICSHGPLAGGSRLTLDEATRRHRPVLHLDLSSIDRRDAIATLARWLRNIDPQILNVAGPRASRDARIGDAVASVLHAALTASGDAPSHP